MRKDQYLREETRKEEVRLEKEKREIALKQILSLSNVKQSNGVYVEKFLTKLKNRRKDS